MMDSGCSKNRDLLNSKKKNGYRTTKIRPIALNRTLKPMPPKGHQGMARKSKIILKLAFLSYRDPNR